jgi:PilZ domain
VTTSKQERDEGRPKPREPRYRKRLKVRFGPEAPETIAFTANLSKHGLLLQTNHVHPAGTMLQIELEVPDYPTFLLLGRVVWVNRVPGRLQRVKSSTMGLSFKEPSQDWIEFCKTWNA